MFLHLVGSAGPQVEDRLRRWRRRRTWWRQRRRRARVWPVSSSSSSSWEAALVSSRESVRRRSRGPCRRRWRVVFARAPRTHVHHSRLCAAGVSHARARVTKDHYHDGESSTPVCRLIFHVSFVRVSQCVVLPLPPRYTVACNTSADKVRFWPSPRTDEVPVIVINFEVSLRGGFSSTFYIFDFHSGTALRLGFRSRRRRRDVECYFSFILFTRQRLWSAHYVAISFCYTRVAGRTDFAENRVFLFLL